MKKFYMVGNTHFDPVWLWKWDEAMASVRATFRSALDRMNEDEEFTYSFATVPVFEWIKDTDPLMFEEIKARIKEGRWELAEGWYLQPDCYALSGESCVRQGLYGQRYLMENFGMLSQTVFNVDSFGHSPMLPQILSKSNIKNYCFMRPEDYHYSLKNPYFKWRSADGSTVYAYRAKNTYKPISVNEASELLKEDGDKVMIIYGVTDHGGAPTKKHIADIRQNPDMKFSTVSAFFEESADTNYIVDGEFITNDFGPCVNCTEVKQNNSRAEYAILNAEKSSVISGRNSVEILKQCWKDIMFNQFHDILGGASIKDAYYDARNLHGRAISTCEYITHTNLQYVTKNIAMLGKNPDNAWNLVVWNLNSGVYDGYIEAEVQWAHEFDWYDKEITLEDNEGIVYKCQKIREYSVIPRFRSRFVFRALIPSMGYKVFKVVCSGNDAEIVEKPHQNPYKLFTDRYTFEISRENGSLTIINNETGKIISDSVLAPECFEDEGDTWCFNIKQYGEKKGSFALKNIEVTEDGIHRIRLKLTLTYGESKLFLYYTFYKKEDYFDVRYKINWNESHTAFKLMCPRSGKIKVGVPYGCLEREDMLGDVPLNKYIECDNFSVVTDSIFAYSSDTDTLGLTVLRSPIYGDLRLEEINLSHDYDITQQGITEGRLRYFMNRDNYYKADMFCNGVVVIDECNHGGTEKASKSYANLSCDNAMISALKYSEDNDGIVLRVNEYKGKATICELTLFDRKFNFELSPYEIKTLKIADEKILEVNMLEW